MSDPDPDVAERVVDLEAEIADQKAAVDALLGAFESLSTDLSELVAEAPDGDDRLTVLEERQRRLVQIVADLHTSVEAIATQSIEVAGRSARELETLADEMDSVEGDS